MTPAKIIDALPTCKVCGQQGLCNCRLCLETKGGQLNTCSKCAAVLIARIKAGKAIAK
jgi:hypothetical protein